MNLAILCQEEPVYLGPFLCHVIREHPESIQAVFIAGRRGAGEKTATFASLWESLQVYWLILEPAGFFRTVFLRLRGKLLGEHDPASVADCAKKLGIPVFRITDPNGATFISQLQKLNPDLVLNQSELLLKKDVLSVPRIGFINRHASLLPRYRGRLASFRAHADTPPEYGVTIHLVDEGVDTGAIVLQKTISGILPQWSYPKVMDALCRDAHTLFWQAVELLSGPGFTPLSNTAEGKAYRFPTLAEAREYRKTLAQRRGLKK